MKSATLLAEMMGWPGMPLEEYWPLTEKRAKWIRKLSRRVHQLDAVLRPLG